jgi:preprotein translocase subunit YajC
MNNAADGQVETAQMTGELAIGDEVVAMAGLKGRLAGISRLVVRRGAIVTPAVRDLLREKEPCSI